METELLWGFNLQAWITIVTVLGMFTTLLLTKLRADVVFLAAIGILLVTGVLDAKEAFSGFSSSSVVVIGVLFVVVAGLTYTGVLQWIVKNLLGQPNSYGKAVIRLMLPVAGLSSFLSNTTVVAMFVGIVKMWSKKLGISKYATRALTEFSCVNEACCENGRPVYLNHCFNKQSCNSIIDSRDSNTCPNGQYICPKCGACCSTENFKLRRDNLLKTEGAVSDWLLKFIDSNKGHWEKKEFYCYKCGKKILNGKCDDCGVEY